MKSFSIANSSRLKSQRVLVKVISSILFITLAGCGSAPEKSITNDGTKPTGANSSAALVIMTDFGLKDGAVSAMKGVAHATAPDLFISDLTHEVKPFNIWEGAFRLVQTYKYWPQGTVFVTVVDPGVGSARKSIIARSKSGHYFVGPDNGLLTLVNEESPIEEVISIDESKQRLKGSEDSYTFHGRDLYVYVGARLASGQLKMQDAGTKLETPLVKIEYTHPILQNGKLLGTIPVLDPQYGNVWTNIPKKLVTEKFGRAYSFKVTIRQKNKVIYSHDLQLAETFSAVPEGQPLLYFNSLLNLSIALNQGDFAAKNKISYGPDWQIEVQPVQ